MRECFSSTNPECRPSFQAVSLRFKLEFYRCPLQLSLIQRISAVPTFVVLEAPKSYFKKNCQCFFPNVVPQL
uniref:Uncharacterized protein n=1 Tax=Anguilla anguilla TaxID=7936 RepID=A0A0E9XA96_ANGAN